MTLRNNVNKLWTLWREDDLAVAPLDSNRDLYPYGRGVSQGCGVPHDKVLPMLNPVTTTATKPTDANFNTEYIVALACGRVVPGARDPLCNTRPMWCDRITVYLTSCQIYDPSQIGGKPGTVTLQIRTGLFCAADPHPETTIDVTPPSFSDLGWVMTATLPPFEAFEVWSVIVSPLTAVQSGWQGDLRFVCDRTGTNAVIAPQAAYGAFTTKH